MVKDDSSTESGSSRNGEDQGNDGVESSFYGNGSTKAAYEKDVAAYDPNTYWRVHDLNVQVVAARAIKRAPNEWPTAEKRRKMAPTSSEAKEGQKSPAKPEMNQDEPSPFPRKTLKRFNPYEGDEMAIQFDESVTDFLNRLQPSSVQSSQPYIWAAYFYSKYRPLDENIAAFRRAANKSLSSYMNKKHDLEAKDPNKTAGAITRILTPDRKNLQDDLKIFAGTHGVKTGKWMLFPHQTKVDAVWAKVVHGTVDGRLGCAAKVATSLDKPDDPTRLICIYTEDFADVNDVRRVLMEIKRLKLMELAGLSTEGGDSIYYKCDAYTYLDITSQNEYKLKASMYSSRDMFAEMSNGSHGLKV